MKQDAIKSLFTRITNKAYVTVVQPMAEREFISGGGKVFDTCFFVVGKVMYWQLGFRLAMMEEHAIIMCVQ